MNAVLRRPPEGDLHAYVDGHLEPARRAEVELWLTSNADDAERVNAWRRHKEALHAAFDGTLEDPVPERLLRAARPQKNRLWGLRAEG